MLGERPIDRRVGSDLTGIRRGNATPRSRWRQTESRMAKPSPLLGNAQSTPIPARNRYRQVEPPLRARLVVPAAPTNFVARPRLARHLDPATAGPVTVVTAAPGWGKPHWPGPRFAAPVPRPPGRPVEQAAAATAPGPDDPRRLWPVGPTGT